MRKRFKAEVSLTALAVAAAFATGAAAADAPPATVATVDEVIVTAQQARKEVRSDGNVGVLGSQSALSIPFNLTTYTSKLILDQQSETIGAVLQNDPSVRVTLGSGNQSELFVVRGFALNGDDISFDGLYGVLPRQLISPELYESVQVLNGASAFLYGAAPSGSGVGGGIDLSPKRATKDLFRATASYIQSGIYGGAGDVGQRFGPDDEFGVRINTVYRSGESAIRGERRYVGGDSLDLDYTTDRVRLSADLGYEDQRANDTRPEVKLAAGVAVPSAPRATANFGQPWTYTALRDVYSMVHGEFDITPNVMAYAAAGVRAGHEKGDYSTLTVTNATTGAATGGRLLVPRLDNNASVLAGIRAKFSLGPISNQVNAGGSALREENHNAFSFGAFPPGQAASSTTFFTNLYNAPTVSAPVNSTLPSSGGALSNPPLVSRTAFQSLFVSDTLGAFSDHALLIVGLRGQNIVVQTFSRGTLLQTSQYNKSADTPVVGLVVKPTDHFSVYANRIEALVQGPVAPVSATTINPGQVFSPFISVQYEAGAKLAYRGLTGALALFQIQQPSAFSRPVTGSATLTQFTVDGQQTNRGLELTLNGEPNQFIRFIGGFTLNDAKLTKTLNGVNNGKTAVGVPDYQANLGVEIIPPMLRQAVLTARIETTGPQYLDVGNTQKLPSWTRLDLGARYVLVVDKHPITLRLSAENVANAGYWESGFGSYLVMGEPRTVKASMTFEY